MEDKTYSIPSGVDYSFYINGKRESSFQALSYEASYVGFRQDTGTHPASITLIQSNLKNTKRLEPGVLIDSLILKASSELGEQFDLKFKNVRVLSVSFGISVDDLITEYKYTCSGVYIEQELL